ncbi:MAG TPA: NUDIX domain-containing protein [Polyangiaceae bacterium]|nr:NUDIX domain-containing protein [Polyangiaceae bacterium]
MSTSEIDADLAVVIGRFQPFHLGHQALVEHALAVAPRALLIVGSASAPRTVKNPFSAEERIATIRASLTPEQQARVSFAAVRDYYDESRWTPAVKAAVARESRGRIALVGFHKDDSSSYLTLFPEWREHALPRQAPIDGTELRRVYYDRADAPEVVAAVPPAVARFLEEFRGTPHFARLREELAALEDGKLKYGTGPFVTVDALVTHQGNLLLVQRGRAPGRDLWALPGGFLEGSERLVSAAIRELQEETQVVCSAEELRSALQSVVVFDHPQRSQRGRTITHAHFFALPASVGAEAPRVEGADDARDAHWFPIAQVAGMSGQLFDDHYQIIDHFLSISSD